MQIHSLNRRRRPIPLTALVDVVFILLFFFMLASSYQNYRGIDLALAGAGTQVAEPSTELFVLRMLADGSLLLDDVALDEGELLDRLSAQPDSRVVVQPGAGVVLQQVVALMDRLRSSGARLALGRLPESS